ncbi:MAG TPA: hypothetical protein VL947_06075, partial [Cytophagales bacterium]|nr:hypothetical protein [Cytophagales bacterium]
MSSQLKKSVNQRFIEISKSLVKSKKVKTLNEFCQTLGIHPQIVSDIKHDKRSVTLEMLSNLYRHFLVSPIYLIEGIGSTYLNPIEQPSNSEIFNDPLNKYVKGSAEDLIRELEEN